MSLRRRLVLFIAVAIAAALLVQGVFGYLNFQRLLYTDLDHDLTDYLAEITKQVRALPGEVSGETLSFTDIDARFDDYLTSARIIHEGRIKETQGDFPADVPLIPRTVRSFGSWRVGSVQLARDLFIQGAIASRAPAYSLGRYRQTVVLTTLVVSALGTLAALWLSGPLLRPLRHLQLTTRRVADSGDLSLRVPVSGRGELADLSRTFNHMMERLAGFLERETLFTRNASHELRTPLASMRLQLSAYKEGLAAPGETLEVMEQEVERMTRISNALLVLAREGRSQQTILDVAQLAREVAAYARVSYRGPGHLELTGDPILLRQALSNLLENTEKHAPGAPAEITLEYRSEGGTYAVLGVQDTGPGMSREVMERAAEAFYRAPGTRVPGSGLGLSVVAQIAEVHGGRLVLEHNASSGVRANLWLALR